MIVLLMTETENKIMLKIVHLNKVKMNNSSLIMKLNFIPWLKTSLLSSTRAKPSETVSIFLEKMLFWNLEFNLPLTMDLSNLSTPLSSYLVRTATLSTNNQVNVPTVKHL